MEVCFTLSSLRVALLTDEFNRSRFVEPKVFDAQMISGKFRLSATGEEYVRGRKAIDRRLAIDRERAQLFDFDDSLGITFTSWETYRKPQLLRRRCRCIRGDNADMRHTKFICLWVDLQPHDGARVKESFFSCGELNEVSVRSIAGSV